MPRSSSRRRLSLEDVHLCKQPGAVLWLFSKLGYQVEPEAVPLPTPELGFSPADAAAIRHLYLLADQDGGAGLPLQVILFELEEVALARLRSLAGNLLNRGGNYLLVATSDYRQLTFIHPRREAGRVKIRKLVVDTSHPTRHDLDVLEGLAADGLDPEALYQAHCEAFDVDKVTSRFYREYAGLFLRIEQAVQSNNQGRPEFYKAEYLHAFTQRLLGRLMFLYFIQKKGWLAGDPRFLTNQCRAVARTEGNYYALVLEPLFFDTLNRRRPHDESRWGAIPYLNGGLFEKDYDFLVVLPNELFDPGSDGGILGFFNNYNFTVAEDTPVEQEVAVDPEMLGKVFENMMEERERGKSGTFYTPRPIVHYMCREALLGYLQDRTGLDRALLAAQFDEDAAATLTVPQARTVERALDEVRVLDPAVGTGAFLVGILHELVALKRACYRAEGAEVRRGGSLAAGWKRQFIAEALHGVDIKEEAIEIARLRLWLSLVVDLERDQVEALPNLDYKLMVGNSLLETLGGKPILQLETAPGQQLGLGLSETEQALADLHRLKDSFFAAEPEDRPALRAEIQEQEKRIVLGHLNERMEALAHQRDELARKGALVNWKGMAREQRRLEGIARELGTLAETAGRIEKGEAPPFFLYRLHFFDVFQGRGGFDIVIANPPYVNTKDTSGLEYLKDMESQYGWADDLYAHFIFRAFDLARTNGLVIYITSDTYFTISTKLRVRELLQGKMLDRLIQCDPFQATVDAAIFCARNCATPAGGVALQFIQARYAPDDQFDVLILEPAWEESLAALAAGQQFPVQRATQQQMRRYGVQVDVYRRALKRSFFEPSPGNIALYNRYAERIGALVEQWWDKVADSSRFSTYLSEIKAHCTGLRPGDITLLGLVADGGVGLQTGDNGRFLGYLEGTPEAESVKARWQQLQADWQHDPRISLRFRELLRRAEHFGIVIDALKREFDAFEELGLKRGELYKVVSVDQIAGLEQYPEADFERIRINGIPAGRPCWLPYRKGDPEGNRWVSGEALFIEWSESNVSWLKQSKSSRFQNPYLYLTAGVTWTNLGNHVPLKARMQPLCIPDQKGLRLTPIAVVSPEYFLALLNSNLISHFCKQFINNTASYNTGDLRLLPLVVPTPEQHARLEGLARQAIELQTALLRVRREGQAMSDSPELQRRAAELQAVEAEVSRAVEEIYGVAGLGPFNEF